MKSFRSGGPVPNGTGPFFTPAVVRDDDGKEPRVQNYHGIGLQPHRSGDPVETPATEVQTNTYSCPSRTGAVKR